MDIISQADWIIDMGLGADKNGGEIVFEGLVKDIIRNSQSLTGIHLDKYLITK
ncbi:MAG: hypothetical protein KIB51_10580 [Dysgonomonas mossii]|nr:hypothetical protein [Dysgonomonas mossii]